MALHPQLQQHLDSNGITSVFTVSGQRATAGAALTHAQLAKVLEVCDVIDHRGILNGNGKLVLQPGKS